MGKIVSEWLQRAESDLDEAAFLLEHDRPLHDVAFFIHQAAEKYLKAFLIKQAWELEKIHDLVKLVKECAGHDSSFEQYIHPMRKITRFYFESRYPVGYDVEYTRDEIQDALRTAQDLAGVIDRLLT